MENPFTSVKQLRKVNSPQKKVNIVSGSIERSPTKMFKTQPDDEISKNIPVINLNSISVLQRISSGAFGTVYKAKVALQFNSVACKAPKHEVVDFWEYIKEINLMADLDHENVVRLIGISDHIPLPWIIMELMQHGDLLHFITKRRSLDIPRNLHLWTQMSLDVAKGMEYLHWIKLMVHCDLHTQNCMVGTNNVVKIGDFGLSFKYETEDEEKIILDGEIGTLGRPDAPPPEPGRMIGGRWKAPELFPGPGFPPVLSRPCDVWAFGILLYELWTEGRVPYEAVPDNIERIVSKGHTPVELHVRKSVIAPEPILELMKSTWNYSPYGRPTFKTIVEILKDALNKTEKIYEPEPECYKDSESNESFRSGNMG